MGLCSGCGTDSLLPKVSPLMSLFKSIRPPPTGGLRFNPESFHSPPDFNGRRPTHWSIPESSCSIGKWSAVLVNVNKVAPRSICTVAIDPKLAAHLSLVFAVFHNIRPEFIPAVSKLALLPIDTEPLLPEVTAKLCLEAWISTCAHFTSVQLEIFVK